MQNSVPTEKYRLGYKYVAAQGENRKMSDMSKKEEEKGPLGTIK